MIFYLHYILATSGLSGVGVLLAVYLREYTDASQTEIGALLMSFPFVGMVIKPLFCSMADRRQAHKLYFVLALLVELVGYSAFALVPLFPQFYTNFPRLAWYLLVGACHLGNSGLGVAWSLGDCLAMNMSQKKGTPFGRMRLMGTVSWGVYGFIIGQINEVPALPKYLPAFIILLLSLVVEIGLVLVWNNDDFVMVDPLQQHQQQQVIDGSAKGAHQQQHQQQQLESGLTPGVGADTLTSRQNFVNSTPSSLGGTLRLNANAAGLLRDVFEASDDLQRRLKSLEQQQQQQQATSCHDTTTTTTAGPHSPAKRRKNPQLVLLRLILAEDGRLVKYIVLFTLFGLMLAPMNFLFVSMEEVSSQRGYNFSQLAGAVLISQAAIETLAFLAVPWTLRYVSRSASLSFAYLIMTIKWYFYAHHYYQLGVSPYWAVVGEWAHGLGYGVFCTIQADVALMFASQSRLFIGELRRLGYLSELGAGTPSALIEAEEQSIKMALRATMQALFDGFMSGLGMGAGALLCGVFIELYSYTRLWQFYYVICGLALAGHQLVELSGSRWSDSYAPSKGTKAYEIRQLSAHLAGARKAAGDERVAGVAAKLAGDNPAAEPPGAKQQDGNECSRPGEPIGAAAAAAKDKPAECC